jgi:hypothetical protein
VQVVDALAPLVHEKRRWFGVAGFDPVGEESPLVGFVPEVLIKVGISDFFEGVHIIDGHQVRVEVHELEPDLLEHTLREQVAFDTGERLVRVIVSLLDEG